MNLSKLFMALTLGALLLSGAAFASESDDVRKLVTELSAKVDALEGRVATLEQQGTSAWSCTAMCGQTPTNFRYVYGTNSVPALAFQKMEQDCPAPNALFVDFQRVGNQYMLVPATLKSACAKALAAH